MTPASVSLPHGTAAPWREHVVGALVGLGWPVRQATEAVDSVAGSDEDDRALDVQEPPEMAQVLRAALHELGRA